MVYTVIHCWHGNIVAMGTKDVLKEYRSGLKGGDREVALKTVIEECIEGR